jgi:hypothetical protein
VLGLWKLAFFWAEEEESDKERGREREKIKYNITYSCCNELSNIKIYYSKFLENLYFKIQTNNIRSIRYSFQRRLSYPLIPII